MTRRAPRLLCLTCHEQKVVTEPDPHAYGNGREMTYCRSCGTIYGLYIVPRRKADALKVKRGAGLVHELIGQEAA
jgi:hypothetical protein